MDISKVLAECKLRLVHDGDFFEAETLDISQIGREDLSLSVQVPKISIDGLPLRKDDLKLIVVATDNTLKRSEVIFSLELDEIGEEPFQFSETQMEQFSWVGNSLVDVALVLITDRQLEPGSPFLAGHWVAKKTFSLSKGMENPIFPVLALSGEEFKRRGLPEDTVYYVDFIHDSLNVPHAEIGNAIHVFIHEDVFNAIARNEKSYRLAERILFSEIAACILANGLQNWDQEEEIREDGVLFDLMRKLELSTGCKPEKQKELANKSGYIGLKALFQSQLNLKRAFISA
jgi:hypothetical protein